MDWGPYDISTEAKLARLRMVTRLHFSITKLLVLELIRQHGVQKVLVNFEGTDADAIEAIAADPRELFVLAPCDNQRADGSCGGHRELAR